MSDAQSAGIVTQEEGEWVGEMSREEEMSNYVCYHTIEGVEGAWGGKMSHYVYCDSI